MTTPREDAVPVPDDKDDVMDERRKRGDDESQSPAKTRRGEGQGVSEELLRTLLAETTANILPNHAESLYEVVSALEKSKKSDCLRWSRR